PAPMMATWVFIASPEVTAGRARRQTRARRLITVKFVNDCKSASTCHDGPKRIRKECISAYNNCTFRKSERLMATQASVPVYQLYGEREQWPTPDMVHCELIADRSKLHDWQIKLHQHHGLVQMLYLKGGDARVGLDGRYQDMQAGQLVVVPQMCVHG